NAHELLVAQFAADGPEDTGSARLQLVVDQHGGVLVETDVGAVGTTPLLLGANDDAADHVTLLHRGAGDGVLHRSDKDVTDRRVTAARTTQHADAEHFLRTGVVGHLETGFLLDHRARSTTSVRRQRLSLDNGRVSWTRTRSPIFASFFSSCT